MGGGFGREVAGDGDVDDAAGGDGRGEKDGGKFDLGECIRYGAQSRNWTGVLSVCPL